MIDPRLAHSAHSEPEKQPGDLEHVSKITERALYPVTKLRSCASCGGRFSGQDLFEVGDDHLMFFEGDELCRSCASNHGILWSVVAVNRALLTSKHSSFSPWGQSNALCSFVRYDTKKKSGAHSGGERGKEEWAPVIWLYSKHTYVHVNPDPNKCENLQTPPSYAPHEDHEQFK